MRNSAWQWRLTVESPWFYAVWFCVFGAIVLFVGQEKYGERQAGIERRFQARSQTARPQVTEGSKSTQAQPRPPSAYSTPGDTVIPLWPLGLVLAVFACAAGLLAIRAGHSSRVKPQITKYKSQTNP